MFESKMKTIGALTIGALFATAIGGTAMAQRDPQYAAARASGAAGEKPDGYLGFPTPPSAAVKAMVEGINIKRKAAYTRKAQATNSTVEQFAFTSGCNLIMRTTSGEKYQTASGTWNTRDASDPVRDSRCP